MITAPTRRFLFSRLVSRSLLLLASLLLPGSPGLAPQELKHRTISPPALSESSAAPDVLSHQKLTPPLLGNTVLRFSPDGSRFLVQVGSGLFVLSRSPMQILMYASVGEAYPAMFSSDSQGLTVLGHNLVLTTWQLSNPRNPKQQGLPADRGCLDVQLSTDTLWITCLGPDLSLELYRTSDLQRVFSQKIGPDMPAAVHLRLPIRRDSPFATPFGFMSANDFTPLEGRGALHAPLFFSPDGKFLLLNEESASFRLDLPSLTKTNLPAFFHRHPRSVRGIFSPDAALVSDPKKDPGYAIVSLRNGEVLTSMTFSADTASPATNPRYALLAHLESSGTTLFDLQKNIPVTIPLNLAADVWGDELALLDAEGEVRLFHLGGEQAVAVGRLPLAPLPQLRSALVDPALATLAVSLSGAAGTFDLNTGKRLASLKSFHGVSFASSESAFLSEPVRGKPASTVQHWTRNQQSSADSPDWIADKAADFVPSRHSFVSYSFYSLKAGDLHRSGRNSEIPFELRGLDPATGRELWQHSYQFDPPVPFADPQGGRIVLGWKANTESARSSAKHFPGTHDAYKKQKIKDLDSYFEVLDAGSGASLGGVLIQFGSGPATFDSAFSEGDFLFLAKDLYRLSVFHLGDSVLLGRLRGAHPTVSAEPKILALDEGSGKLALYRLADISKVALRQFPDSISYLCFSEKGDRLLVLTAHQEVFILDVKKTIEEFPPPLSEPAENPVENP